MGRLKSHAELMTVALEAAVLSPDPRTQNGAILSTVDGRVFHTTNACNEFPRGIHYKVERWEAPLKYSIIEHAERNAIYAAARNGVKTDGLLLACPWAACSDCARAIIQAGIVHLVTLEPKKGTTHDRWLETVEVGMMMLEEANIEVTYLDPADFAHVGPIVRNGAVWKPC